jgi:hypothetical protein
LNFQHKNKSNQGKACVAVAALKQKKILKFIEKSCSCDSFSFLMQKNQTNFRPKMFYCIK